MIYYALSGKLWIALEVSAVFSIDVIVALWRVMTLAAALTGFINFYALMASSSVFSSIRPPLPLRYYPPFPPYTKFLNIRSPRA